MQKRRIIHNHLNFSILKTYYGEEKEDKDGGGEMFMYLREGWNTYTPTNALEFQYYRFISATKDA